MYKDKDRQKEANRKASQHRRDKAKGMTQEGVVIPDHPVPVIPKSDKFRGLAITCFEDLPPDVQKAIRQEPEDQWSIRTVVAIHYQHLFPHRYYPNHDLGFTTLMAKA